MKKAMCFLACIATLTAVAYAQTDPEKTEAEIQAAWQCAEVSSAELELEQQRLFERPEFDEATVTALAQAVWGEWDGGDKTEKAAVVWCILNRADNWDSTALAEVTAEGQFHGYNSRWPVTDENKAIVEDVLYRHYLESLGVEDVGRVLPKEYMWFHGDNYKNYFRDDYQWPYNTWDWSLESPYE